MVVRTFAFGNIGRDKDPNKNSRPLDYDALRALKSELPDEKTAVILCEINEGDDNNEYHAIRQTFKGWRLYFRNTREPILLSPDNPPAKGTVHWVANSAVEKWSPRRSINVLKLQDERQVLLTCHPAAGANGQGARPQWARPLLQRSFDLTLERRKLIKQRLNKNGWNVTELSDLNSYLFWRDSILRERLIFRDATDYGIVMPSLHYNASFHHVRKVNFNIDSHDGHIMRGRYHER
jgi:hypothetical protein